MSRVRRSVALVCVLALLAMSTLGAGWVICAGAGGHVAIESLAAGCCGDDVDDHDAPPPADDDCGDCADVLLARVSPVRDADPEPIDVGTAAALAATFGAALASPWADASAPRAPRAPPRPPPLPRHLATTVLRL